MQAIVLQESMQILSTNKRGECDGI